MAINKIQVIERSDRFNVELNEYPVLAFIFKEVDGIGVSKGFARMNANSEAYKLAVQMTSEGKKIKLYSQEIK